MRTFQHVSAMLAEAIEALNCRPGGIYVDCTLGGGGHSQAICEKIGPDGILIGLDQDDAAIEHNTIRLAPYASRIHLFHSNYVHLPEILSQLKIPAVDGILLDLGLSQYQLEGSGRGFSFQADEPLDMRMDQRQQISAHEIVNHYSQDELQRIFFGYGEERWSKRIARAIAEKRRRDPLQTTGQLVDLIRRAVPATAGKQKIHPATRVFMALRIAVNKELDCLENFLRFSTDLLKVGGRLCILSFHSLEDRMVKNHFRSLAQGCTCPPKLPQCVCNNHPKVRLITKKVLRPTKEEIAANPMARSTRLRAVEKLDTVEAA